MENTYSETLPNKRRRISFGPYDNDHDGPNVLLPNSDNNDNSEDTLAPIVPVPNFCLNPMMNATDGHNNPFPPVPQPRSLPVFPVPPLIQPGDKMTATTTTTSNTGQLRVFEISLADRAEERRLLMDVLGGAPTRDLGQLTLVSRLEWSLPLTTVTNILRNATLLTSLSLYSIAFQGDQHDFADFCDCLKHHPSLKEIHLVDCYLVDQSIPIDSLLRALAFIPTLETVEVYAMDLERESPMSLMSPASVGDLCRSPTITTLSLEDLDLNDNHVQELVAALQQNETMKHLTLWDCNITDKGGQLLAKVIRDNTHLKKMDLCFNDVSDRAYKAIAMALRRNETLESLSLHGNNSLHKQQQQQQQSKRCGRDSASDTRSGYEALLEVLRDHNHVLEDLILDTEEDPRIALYLIINRNRHILQDENVSRKQLVDCLAEYNNDEEQHLSFVYYLLQTNPELCDVKR